MRPYNAPDGCNCRVIFTDGTTTISSMASCALHRDDPDIAKWDTVADILSGKVPRDE